MTSPLTDFAGGDRNYMPARYQPRDAWFVSGMQSGLHCNQAWAPGDQLVELLQGLLGELSTAPDATVDLAMWDTRSGRRWESVFLERSDVRDAIGRLRLPLVAFGGVEITVYAANDQLTLTPEMLLVVYARTSRWAYLLEGMGLHERASMPTADWRSWAAPRFAAPSLMEAVEDVVARLGLTEIHS